MCKFQLNVYLIDSKISITMEVAELPLYEDRECRRVQSLSQELDLSTQEFNAFCIYLDALKVHMK